MKAMTAASLLAAAVTLAACSGDDASPPTQAVATTATTTAPTTTIAAGPPAFLAEARAMDFGSKDFASAPDDALLEFGNTVCEGMSENGLDFGRVVQGLAQTDAHPTTGQATVLAKSAVRNLCPQYSDAVPA